MKTIVRWKFFKNKNHNKKLINEYYDLYSKTQYWSINELKDYQFLLFKKLFDHSYENNSYYRNLMQNLKLTPSDFTNINDISKIPILTKDIIRQNHDSIKTSNLPAARFLTNSTSGFSGSNLVFYSDANAISSKTALAMRRYNWMDSSIFDKEFNLWGASWDLKQNNTYAKIKRFFNLENTINYSGYELSDESMIEIHRILKRSNPLLLKSYPSILYSLANFFEQNKLTYSPKAIHIGGEKLYDFQREKIEAIFNAKVFDFYGARDMPNIAQNCDHFSGLHLFMENVIAEVLDDNNNPIEEGEGKLVITSLHNYVMPFIRYEIGDRVRVSKNKTCGCGRNLILFDEIIGRTFDIIRFPNGNQVGGSFWTLLMRSVEGIKDFQIIQEKIDKITIRYTRNDLKINIETDLLTNRIKEYAGDLIVLQYEEVNNIPVTKAGKIQFVISKIK